VYLKLLRLPLSGLDMLTHTQNIRALQENEKLKKENYSLYTLTLLTSPFTRTFTNPLFSD
jgi:hypothetical protein